MLIVPLQPDLDLLHQVVSMPVRIFTEASIALGQEVWTWIIDTRPDLESRVMAEVSEAWTQAMQNHRGLFSTVLKFVLPPSTGSYSTDRVM